MSALRLELSPSPRLAALILGAHGAAALSAWSVLPGLPGLLAAAAFAALGGAAAWSRALHRAHGSVRAIELGNPTIMLDLAGGDSLESEVSGRRYVAAWMVALPVRGRTLLVTRDMVGEEGFRLLRIWALWGRLPASATGAGRAVAAKQLAA